MPSRQALQVRRQATKIIQMQKQQGIVYRPGTSTQTAFGKVEGELALLDTIDIDFNEYPESDTLLKGANATCDVLHDSVVQEFDVLEYKSSEYKVVGDTDHEYAGLITHRTLSLKLDREAEDE